MRINGLSSKLYGDLLGVVTVAPRFPGLKPCWYQPARCTLGAERPLHGDVNRKVFRMMTVKQGRWLSLDYYAYVIT